MAASDNRDYVIDVPDATVILTMEASKSFSR
jgi:hypothetical protein